MKTQQLISDKYVVPLQYLKEKSLLDPILQWKKKQKKKTKKKKKKMFNL